MTNDVQERARSGPRWRASLRPGVIVAVLAAVLATPLLSAYTYPIVAAAVLLVLVTLGWMWWPRRGTERWWRRVRGSSESLLLQLSPVIMLTLAFPFATQRMSEADIAGVSLPTVVLASSLTVPWLAQVLCLPLYRGIGQYVWQNDIDGARRRFFQVWPTVAAQTLPFILVFAVIMQVAMQWPLRALAAYVVLSALNGLFAQSLVMSNVAKKRIQWAASWATYAVALLIAPTLWWLPPLAAIAVPLLFMRHDVREMLTPDSAGSFREVMTDAGRGLLTGTFLWADKVFIFTRYGSEFAVQTVFIALLPAVIVYNYYFVRLAAPFDSGVADLRSAMERDSFVDLDARVQSVAQTVVSGLEKSALMSAVLGVFAVSLLALHRDDIGLAAPVAVASVLFLVIAIAAYKLEYIGRTGLPQVIGGAHLLTCSILFAVMPTLPSTYLALIVVDLVLLLVIVRAAIREWRTAEYTLFWRHATAW